MSTYSNSNFMMPSSQPNVGVSNGTMQQPPVMATQQMQQQHPSMSTATPTTASGAAGLSTISKNVQPTPQYLPAQGVPSATVNGRDSQSNLFPTPGLDGQTQSQCLPPHMRQQGLILTNGGSTVSSRTGSPAFNNSPVHEASQYAIKQAQDNQSQQQQQQEKQQYSSQTSHQVASKYGLPPQQHFTSIQSNPVNALNNTMQNMSLNSLNASSSVVQSTPGSKPTNVNSFPQNLQANFKTSALNTFSGDPPTVSSKVPSSLSTTQAIATPPQSNAYSSSAFPRVRTYPNPVSQASNQTAPNSIPQSTNTFDQRQFINKQQIQGQDSNYVNYQSGQMMPPPPSSQFHAYSQAYHAQPPLGQEQFAPQQQQVSFNNQEHCQPAAGDQSQQYQYPNQPNYNPQMNVVQQGFNRLWGQDTIDLMQNRHILTPETLKIPKIVLHNQFQESINCHPDIIRCTVAKVPDSQALLQKSRLPLGILIHPFRDVNSLPVIQCPNIVRCRLCRTYINPFVYFVDSKMWKCNLCYRVNELPEDFQFDPATKTYGDVTRRPEVRSSTIEFIAPSEYMLRPPQPAIYLFLFDVSIIAQQSGYLDNVCDVLSNHLDDMPGDARTQIGFIAFNSEVHFYSMAEGYNQPHEITLVDIDDPFLPRPDNLLVNLKECKELVKDLLSQLPKRFADTHDPGSALGSALQVASKLMQATGGRVTVFQTCLPNKGPGALEPREDPNNRSAKDVVHLNPATDFYKRYALECSGFQVAIDLFLLNQQYSDLATISGISKHSGGVVHHFPLYQKTKSQHVELFKNCLKRYLTRKIGFEAVMRIRCTRGLQVHTFHGNFFVRSTDLLSLPNVNPDAGYGMQISYEESLTDVKTVCFQAALLYTNSEGERRIRVHTLCLPVSASLTEVMYSADTKAIVGLLSKMAVDRSITSNLSDAREAFINATVDIFNAFKIAQNLPSGQGSQLVAPKNLGLLPLYISAMLKHPAFRTGKSTRLDDRVYAMDCMKTLPLDQLIRYLYPEFYHIDGLFYNLQNSNNTDEDTDVFTGAQRLQLSAEYLDSRYMFLLDCGTLIIIYVGLNVPSNILERSLGFKSTVELPDYCFGLPEIDSPENDILQRFIMKLNDDKPYPPVVQIIRDTSTAKATFIEKLIDDRSESSLSYYEFLQHIRSQVK